MRFLFITTALLLFSCAMAKEENDTAGDDKPLTKEEAKEIVFSVEKELAKEIDGAVKTINEVFGNPACIDKTKRHIFWGVGRKRATGDFKLVKRGWGDVWETVTKVAKTYSAAKTVVAAGAALGKRSESESESKVEKREDSDFDKVVNTINAVSTIASIFGKRSEPVSELKIQKRGKSDFDKAVDAINTVGTVAAIASFFGKRSETKSELKLEKRGKSDFDKVIDGLTTPPYTPRIWSNLFGKRSAPENVLKDEKPGPNSKESDYRNDSDDSLEAENEFRADITKLGRALEVLNDVLLIAKATAESE